MAKPIRTTRQAWAIREGIAWGRSIHEARTASPEFRDRLTEAAKHDAARHGSELMVRAIIRTAYPWTKRV